jgi:hypothetical protein
MISEQNLFMYLSLKSKGIFGFSADAHGAGLPASLSPWQAFGVLRPDQTPPHGMSRRAIEDGVRVNGYQLWREKTKPASGKPVKN